MEPDEHAARIGAKPLAGEERFHKPVALAQLGDLGGEDRLRRAVLDPFGGDEHSMGAGIHSVVRTASAMRCAFRRRE
jgi:hypothetical protein